MGRAIVQQAIIEGVAWPADRNTSLERHLIFWIIACPLSRGWASLPNISRLTLHTTTAQKEILHKNKAKTRIAVSTSTDTSSQRYSKSSHQRHLNRDKQPDRSSRPEMRTASLIKFSKDLGNALATTASRYPLISSGANSALSLAH
jgi:hypothetical protein